MDKETKNLMIHIAVMFSISLVFMIYFRIVEHDVELQKQIIDNASVLPQAQLLAYGGYFVYVLTRLIPRYRENRKIKRDLQNILILVGRAFHEYVIWMIDLIGITITFYAFFIYSNPYPSPKMFGIMNISDAYFLVMVPSLTILSHLLLSKRKLEYR